MRENIHPKYEKCEVTCGCGFSYETRSTKPEKMAKAVAETLKNLKTCKKRQTAKAKNLISKMENPLKTVLKAVEDTVKA